MHVVANWIAKLVQFLYCSIMIIYHADCNSGPFCTCKWTFLCSLVDLLYILVDLLVDLSLTGGFFRAQRTGAGPGYGLAIVY